ncbi:coiled-coil domain-containing protein 177-like isoform X1 [Mytilus trossulus]|uniref:coiled-coil domain-containing protein 177-like isoform X1 n=1 Tax=Mytilus trossulus TaxID=6551 RepID=UPI0030053794
MSEDPKIHIDFFNFEDPVYEDSKYVLTSPRSLEACAKVGVKPVDILYKPLTDFQEELLPQDIPLRTIYNIYDEHEQERQRVLKLCKEERKKLVDGEGTTKKTARRKLGLNSSSQKTGTATQRRSRTPNRSKITSTRSKSEEEKTKSSLQRTRTAWATSIGHKRVTNDELNNRVKELHEESLKLREELLSKKEKRNRQSPKPRPKSTPIRRSRSTSSLVSNGSSCLLNRSTIDSAQPISNTRLKKTLNKSIDTSHVVVTPRDQRILELMMTKGEQERATNRDRFIADLTWEHQRKIEEESRVQSEMKRRRMLAEENRIKLLKKMESEKRRQRREKSQLERKEQSLHQAMQKWDISSRTQQKQKDLQIKERKDKEQLKRRIQTSNKKVKTRDELEMKDLMVQQQDFEIKSVAQRKQDRLLRDSLMKMLHNRKERDQFESRHTVVEKESRENRKDLEKDAHIRMTESERKYQDVLQQRDIQINLNKLERQKKQAIVRTSQHKMEEELEDWRENVMNKRKALMLSAQTERQASESAIKAIEHKALKAHDDRVNREKIQQRNIQKIQDEVEAWKQETEDYIAVKDRKIQTAQQEKDTTILQSRFVASQSSQLRDELKERYGGESFDKKVLRAELFNKLGLAYTKPVTTSKSCKKR